jgi:hypothetical protein
VDATAMVTECLRLMPTGLSAHRELENIPLPRLQ